MSCQLWTEGRFVAVAIPGLVEDNGAKTGPVHLQAGFRPVIDKGVRPSCWM